MIHLDLNEQEKQALSEALKSYLSDMSYEIADTDRMEFREELKAKRDLLKKVLDAVEKARET
ncbi:MAG TPA: hypothetical protein ENI97_05770 [Gammaproteobacteria bacterium]|nr:hypothetical protein [Gammaproteobacteria bacterium]